MRGIIENLMHNLKSVYLRGLCSITTRAHIFMQRYVSI